MPKEISNSCRTDICKGVCCTFLSFHYDKKLDDDFKKFLMLRGIEIKEEWITKSFKRTLRTHLKIPTPCRVFDPETCSCLIYDDRPEHCRMNPTRESPFIDRNECSVLTPQLQTLPKKDEKDD